MPAFFFGCSYKMKKSIANTEMSQAGLSDLDVSVDPDSTGSSMRTMTTNQITKHRK